MALSARTIETAKPKEKPYKLTDGHGLYLYVAVSGTKTWRANYTQGGQQKTRTYGRYPNMGLLDARKAHYAARDKKDTPAQPAMPLFAEVYKDWLRRILPTLSNPKHRNQVINTMDTYAIPVIGSLPLDKIKRTLILKGILEQLSDRPETAHRVAGRVRAVFDYAIDLGYEFNHPAINLSRVLPSRSVKKHFVCIQPDETSALMQAIETYPEELTRRALWLLALTMVRTSELRWMGWSEIKRDKKIWLVPKSRMKLRRIPHVVPLSDAALKHLDALSETRRNNSDLVFESPAARGQPISENTMLFALYRLGYRGRMTGHGFRALASSVLNESGLWKRDAIERQLAHKETDEVRAAYNRAEHLPERVKMMGWWADWLVAQTRA